MVRAFVALSCLCLLASAAMWKIDPEHKVIRVTPTKNQKVLDILAVEDVWGHAEDGSPELRATKHVIEQLVKAGGNFTDITADAQKHFDWMAANNQVCEQSVEECTKNFYAQYQRLAAVHSYLDTLIQARPDIVATKNWGNSFEGKQMRGVVVTSPNSPTNKPVIFYFCGEHAREWLPVMFCVYMAETLSTRYGTDGQVTAILNNYAVHILPVMNPDGYEFSMTSNNMWRKNRQPNSGSTCIGTDLNRNYQFMWNTGGSSPQPCQDTYHGTTFWSAPETLNLRNYAAQTPMVIQTDVHAYGNMWMHPWGYTRTLSGDNTAQQRCGTATVNAIRSVNGLSFASGSIANVIYIASGSSCDNFYGANGVIYSYAPEVRGSSFQPPVSNIAPSNAELWAGFIAQVNCVHGSVNGNELF